MNATNFDYQGHPCFRNEPLYSQFRESFEPSSTDVLFLALNELHPHYMRPEALQRKSDFDFTALRDPRTKQLVHTTLFDHSTGAQQRPKVFRSGISSTLTKPQQLACLRVLQAWQQQQEVCDEDVLIWRRLERKRAKEKEKFDKFVVDHVAAETERMYVHTKQFVEIYQRYYATQSELLLEHYAEDVAYNTHTGLPTVRCFKGDVDRVVEITDVRLVTRMGWIPIAPEYNTNSFARVNANLQRFNDHFSTELRQRRQIKAKFARIVDEHIKQAKLTDDAKLHLLYISLDTLLFLLTAGYYPDLPTEALLEIACNKEDGKYIKFDEPLPARNCGPHIYNQVVENALAAYWSRAGEARWLRAQEDDIHVVDAEETPEIVAVPTQPLEFNAVEFGNYCSAASRPTREVVKTSEGLIEWCLEDTEDVNNLNIYTTLNMPPALDVHAARFMGGNFIKLEHKPEFGVEVMTEYELVKAWLQLTLTQSDSTAATVEHYVKCMRLAATDLTLQLEEHLTLPAVEKQLLEIYHVNVPHMLAGLADLLRMLINIPIGRYMLRYNDKYKNKFMLCAPTQEIKQTTVFLHQLLKQNVSDLCFMMQPYHLPISDSLCSVMHNFHKVLPSMFLPKLPHQVGERKEKAAPKKIYTDAEYVQNKLKKEEEKFVKLRKQWKRRSGAAKRQRKRALRQEQDMQLNKTLFEF